MTSKTDWCFLTILSLACFFVYLNSISHGFTYWDDYVQVVENQYIRHLSFSSLKKIFSSFFVGMYQPITTSIYAIVYQFSALDSIGYHFTSLLFHLLNTILVLHLLSQFFQNKKLVFFLTALFALHPVQVESIAWVSAFSNLVFSFFFLLSISSFLLYLKNGKSHFYLLSLLAFILSCLSKSAAVTLPLVLILFEWYSKQSYKTVKWLNKTPFLLISITIGIVAIFSRESAGHLSDLSSSFSWLDRIFLTSHSLLFYPFQFAFPFQLSAFYPYPKLTDNLLPLVYYLSGILVLFITYLLFKFRNRKRLILGSGFFLISISLVLQIIPVGNQITTDRYLYLPMLGLLIIIGELLKPFESSKYFNLLYLIPVLFSFLSWQQTKIWQNDNTLWNAVIKKYPDVPEAYNNLGTYALKQNQKQQAFDYYNQAIRLQPNYADALSNRGNLYSQSGNTAKAIADFNQAIQLQPHADAYFNRANELSKQGNFSAAIEDYTKSLKIKKNPDTFTNRAFSYLQTRQLSLAEKDLKNAINIDNRFDRAYFLLGLLEQRKNNKQEACLAFKKASQLGNKNAKLAIEQYCN